MSSSVSVFQKKIGYQFRDEELLLQALTHSSFANEVYKGNVRDYERLEFLGDAILELVSSEMLFKAHPEMREGQLTKKRASLVREEALVARADSLDLRAYIRLGKGEEKCGGRDRASIIADVLEAVIGAIFLDSSLEEATSFIKRVVLPDETQAPGTVDYKTMLQEVVQNRNRVVKASEHTGGNAKKQSKKSEGSGDICGELTYELTDSYGPEHDKVFVVTACIGDRKMGRGTGKNKKAAEQEAAAATLKILEKSNGCI